MSSSKESNANEGNPVAQPAMAASADAPVQGAEAIPNRRKSPWANTVTTLNYLSGLSRTGIRNRDRVSDVLLGLCIIIMAVLAFSPNHEWQMPLAGLCDVLCLATVIWFMMNRLGIMQTLTERQAILVCDIAAGIFVFTVLLFINFVLLFKFLLHSQGF